MIIWRYILKLLWKSNRQTNWQDKTREGEGVNEVSGLCEESRSTCDTQNFLLLLYVQEAAALDKTTCFSKSLTYTASHTQAHTRRGLSLSLSQTESCSLADRQATDAQTGPTMGDAYVTAASGCYTTSMFTRTSRPVRTRTHRRTHTRAHKDEPRHTLARAGRTIPTQWHLKNT